MDVLLDELLSGVRLSCILIEVISLMLLIETVIITFEASNNSFETFNLFWRIEG